MRKLTGLGSVHKKIFHFILLSVMWGVVLPAPAGAQESATPTVSPPTAETACYPLTAILPDGSTLRLEQRPERICSVVLAADEILLSLVEPDRIAALSIFADDPHYSNVTKHAQEILGRVTSELEQVVRFRPDLVFVADYSRPEFLALLRKTGLPICRLSNPTSVADTQNNLRLIGRLVGRSRKAEQLIKEMDRRIRAVGVRIEKANQSRRPGVLFLSYEWTAGEDTLYDEVIRLAGGENAAAREGIVGHKLVSLEQILKWNPEFVLVEGPLARRGRGEKLVKQYPLLHALRASREGKIIEIPPAHAGSVSHHLATGIEELAALLYPDLSWPQPARPPRGTQ